MVPSGVPRSGRGCPCEYRKQAPFSVRGAPKRGSGRPGRLRRFGVRVALEPGRDSEGQRPARHDGHVVRLTALPIEQVVANESQRQRPRQIVTH